MAFVRYLRDFWYGATKYPCALLCPRVYRGKFGNEHHNLLQREFYQALLKNGFQRTFWQLVFPGQIAGIIKKIPKNEEGVSEYHIRFYNDGTIECELEVGQWSLKHWTGPRHYGEEGKGLLTRLLESLPEIPKDKQESIGKLFGSKGFTDKVVRPS